jgi:phage-related protein
MNEVEIAIRVATEAADAAAGLDDIGVAAKDMAADIDKAAAAADGALAAIGEKADAVASNATMLAGALGDIGGGLDAVGLGGASDALNNVSTGLMFAAGLADTYTVATQGLSIAKIKDTAASVANRAATIATTVAQKAQIAAQWALNAAMSANPIGLIVIALVALVAGLVLAYQKSETVRDIINAVGDAGQAAIGWVVDKVSDLAGWLSDALPAAWDKVKGVTVGYFNFVMTPYKLLWGGLQDLGGFLRDALPAAWDRTRAAAVYVFDVITTPVRTVKNIIGDIKDFAAEKIPNALGSLQSTAVSVFNTITAPIRTVKNLIKDIKDFIDNLDLGILDDIGGAVGGLLSRPTADSGGVAGRTFTTAAAPTVNIPVTVNGAVDAYSSATQITSLVAGRLRAHGLAPVPS